MIAAATAAVASGCTAGGLPEMSPFGWTTSWESARLTARPPAAESPPAAPAPGVHVLDLEPGPAVLVRVPTPVGDPVRPYRLVLALHGAGGNAPQGLAPLLPFADTHQLLLLAPSSHDSTWDVITQGEWGTDVHRIDQALAQVVAGYRIDPSRLAISGFSDGASYALSLGLANADLFTHIIAFSPGFLIRTRRVGTPQVYLSHGRADAVLPIDQTTRQIVPQLRAAGIPTKLPESTGPHVLP